MSCAAATAVMRWATLTQTRGAADKEVDPKGVDRVKGNHGEGAVQGAGPRGQVTIPGQDLVGGGVRGLKGNAMQSLLLVKLHYYIC